MGAFSQGSRALGRTMFRRLFRSRSAIDHCPSLKTPQTDTPPFKSIRALLELKPAWVLFEAEISFQKLKYKAMCRWLQTWWYINLPLFYFKFEKTKKVGCWLAHIGLECRQASWNSDAGMIAKGNKTRSWVALQKKWTGGNFYNAEKCSHGKCILRQKRMQGYTKCYVHWARESGKAKKWVLDLLWHMYVLCCRKRLAKKKCILGPKKMAQSSTKHTQRALFSLNLRFWRILKGKSCFQHIVVQRSFCWLRQRWSLWRFLQINCQRLRPGTPTLFRQ